MNYNNIFSDEELVMCAYKTLSINKQTSENMSFMKKQLPLKYNLFKCDNKTFIQIKDECYLIIRYDNQLETLKYTIASILFNNCE
jgi:hypothetical protein